MNIEKNLEKKEYVAPQMTVMDMSMTSLLCASGEEIKLFSAEDDGDDDVYFQ